jgi:hypothetical protein
MAGSDTAAHETRPVEIAGPSTAEGIDLMVWQSTTMLDPETVDGVPEDNIFRGTD